MTGAALSPDGRMLALSLVHEFPPGPLYGSVEVINVASGATRAWTGRGAPGYWPGVPSWAGDGTVVVPWWHDIGHGMIPAEITGVRYLDLAAPGGSLAAARLVAFPAPVAGLASALIGPGGDVITSSCRAGHHTATVRVAELSATDGPAGPGAADADGPVRQRRRRPGRDLLDVPGAVGGRRRQSRARPGLRVRPDRQRRLYLAARHDTARPAGLRGVVTAWCGSRHLLAGAGLRFTRGVMRPICLCRWSDIGTECCVRVSEKRHLPQSARCRRCRRWPGACRPG